MRPCTPEEGALATYLDQFSVSVVFLNGDALGTEFTISQHRVTFGRGPGVDLALDSEDVAREHAVIEFWGDAFVIRDLDTDYGVRLNGGEVRTCELKHGDRFQLGGLIFEFLQEERASTLGSLRR